MESNRVKPPSIWVRLNESSSRGFTLALNQIGMDGFEYLNPPSESMARQCAKRECSTTPRRGFRVCESCRGWLEVKQREALREAKSIKEAVAILEPDSEYSDRTNLD